MLSCLSAYQLSARHAWPSAGHPRVSLFKSWMAGTSPAVTGPRVLEKSLRRLEFIGVVLDDGVGEELLAHALDLGAGLVGIALGHFDLDILALTDAVDRAEAE